MESYEKLYQNKTLKLASRLQFIKTFNAFFVTTIDNSNVMIDGTIKNNYRFESDNEIGAVTFAQNFIKGK